MMDTNRITAAIVGLGRMGANMARRLADTGFAITALYDIRPGVASALAAELGSSAPATLAEIAASADFVLTVVTDDAAMQGIFTAPGDNLLTGAAGKIFINFATVSPGVHREIDMAAHAAGASAIEACMASSITQAREGTLYLILAGDPAIVERAAPLLAALSSARRYVGETGRAAQVKALVNMVMNINTAGLAEGLGLGDALGLDLTMLREVFAQTGANSRVLETDGADMQARDHACYFSAAHAAKDSGIAVALAKEAGVNVPLAETALAQYRRMIEKGLGELDKSGVAELSFKGRGGRG
jgi:3-hydroxyisobutyrate dehydrogenase